MTTSYRFERHTALSSIYGCKQEHMQSYANRMQHISIVSLKSNRIEGYDLRDMIRLDLGIRFSYPSKSYPPSRIVSLKSYCIPQIVSLNRIPQIELYRGIRLRDTIEGYDTILRDTIRFEGYDLRDTIKSYPSIFARDTMRDTIVSYPSLCQGLTV